MSLNLATLSGGTATIAPETVEALKARVRGAVLTSGGDGYDAARSVWNATIDLSSMKSVRVDPFARLARVEPGVTLGEFDRECQAFGLVTPVGINSTT